jgi:hypothetical protein
MRSQGLSSALVPTNERNDLERSEDGRADERGAGDDRGSRSPRVKIDPAYYAFLVGLKGDQSNADFARASGMTQMEVSRFFHDDEDKRVTTVANTTAVCTHLKVPYPIYSIRSIEELRWIEAGRSLAELDPETYQDLVMAAKEAAAEADAKSRKQATLKKIRGKYPGRGSDPGDKH